MPHFPIEQELELESVLSGVQRKSRASFSLQQGEEEEVSDREGGDILNIGRERGTRERGCRGGRGED